MAKLLYSANAEIRQSLVGLRNETTDAKETFMATNKRQIDPELAAAKLASARRLVAKLEAAHRAGTLKPINPNAKPVTMAIRVKAA